jgi:hypothetical protein
VIEVVLVCVLMLLAQSRIRNRYYLTKESLVLPYASAWYQLFDSGTDEAFVATMGLDRDTYLYLHDSIYEHIKSTSFTDQGGRHPTLDTYAKLGITLHYLNSTMQQKSLCQIFGCSPAITCRAIDQCLNALVEVLPGLPEACIKWPTPTQMQEFAATVALREPNLPQVFGFIDGLNLPIQEPADPDQQNPYYNSWKGEHTVANVICWTPDGCIAWANINAPGSWHDAAIAAPLYQLLTHHTPTPYCVLSDTAFPRTKQMKDKILSPFKQGEISDDVRIAASQLLYHQRVTSLRQAAEWGNRGLQAAFGRLRTHLPFDTQRRRAIIYTCCMLFNVRTRTGRPITPLLLTLIFPCNRTFCRIPPNVLPNFLPSFQRHVECVM